MLTWRVSEVDAGTEGSKGGCHGNTQMPSSPPRGAESQQMQFFWAQLLPQIAC